MVEEYLQAEVLLVRLVFDVVEVAVPGVGCHTVVALVVVPVAQGVVEPGDGNSEG